jgi:methyl-accepting chemotaxis protein
MTTRPEQEETAAFSKGPLGFVVFSLLMTAAGVAIAKAPHFPAILLSAGACYGALALGYVRACRSASQLRTIKREFSETVEQVVGAALQLAAASQSVSQRMATQSASLSAATGTSELMASITRQTAETGRVAVSLVSEAEQLANQSAAGLASLAGTLRESNTAAGKIGSITKVVDQIAFQTNILALNAAVEAARAGQAGAGFAIVADEVRNLAQRCATASQEISDLAQESIARARAGESEMEQVSGAMHALISHTGKVKGLVDEVAVNSDELARGSDSVLQEMKQVEEHTQGTEASSEETATTGQELSERGETMRTLVARLSRISV